MVNGPDDVYVERKERIVKVDDCLFEGEVENAVGLRSPGCVAPIILA